MNGITEAKTVEEQIEHYIKLIENTIEQCETPASQKIMNVIQSRLKSAKRKKEFRRMAMQSSLFRLITSDIVSPKSLSPKKAEYVKMPDLKPITFRKHIFEDVRNSKKFKWKEIKRKLRKSSQKRENSKPKLKKKLKMITSHRDALLNCKLSDHTSTYISYVTLCV